jgi:hypothetical protein
LGLKTSVGLNLETSVGSPQSVQPIDPSGKS